jgi:hypothetical protein
MISLKLRLGNNNSSKGHHMAAHNSRLVADIKSCTRFYRTNRLACFHRYDAANFCKCPSDIATNTSMSFLHQNDTQPPICLHMLTYRQDRAHSVQAQSEQQHTFCSDAVKPVHTLRYILHMSTKQGTHHSTYSCSSGLSHIAEHWCTHLDTYST